MDGGQNEFVTKIDENLQHGKWFFIGWEIRCEERADLSGLLVDFIREIMRMLVLFYEGNQFDSINKQTNKLINNRFRVERKS